jgi:hypothetical protein
MTEFNLGGESRFSEDGSLPPVETSDLKALWKLGQELRLEFPEPAVISVSQPRFTRCLQPRSKCRRRLVSRRVFGRARGTPGLVISGDARGHQRHRLQSRG